MDNSISTPIQNHLRKLTYLLAALSVTSCIIRNDYNVVFSFLILAIINKYYTDGAQYYSKILFHLIAGLIIIDCIWIGITFPYWSSGSATHSKYWESLSTVHTLAIILAFVQVGVKAFMGFLIFNDYKNQYKQVGELFSLHYDMHPDIPK